MSAYEDVKAFAKLDSGYPYATGDDVVFMAVHARDDFAPSILTGAIMGTYVQNGMWVYRIITPDDTVYPYVTASNIRLPAPVSDEQNYLDTRLDVDSQLD